MVQGIDVGMLLSSVTGMALDTEDSVTFVINYGMVLEVVTGARHRRGHGAKQKSLHGDEHERGHGAG
eukprot:2965062-Ditylum_brightwellii.AAC.1